jgi:hypothetical protein
MTTKTMPKAVFIVENFGRLCDYRGEKVDIWEVGKELIRLFLSSYGMHKRCRVRICMQILTLRVGSNVPNS